MAKIGNKRIRNLIAGISGSADALAGYALVAFLIAGLAGCLAVWHRYVSNPAWSEERQRAYEESKGKEGTLDEKKLDKSIVRFQERSEGCESGSRLADIFRLKE